MVQDIEQDDVCDRCVWKRELDSVRDRVQRRREAPAPRTLQCWGLAGTRAPRVSEGVTSPGLPPRRCICRVPLNAALIRWRAAAVAAVAVAAWGVTGAEPTGAAGVRPAAQAAQTANSTACRIPTPDPKPLHFSNIQVRARPAAQRPCKAQSLCRATRGSFRGLARALPLQWQQDAHTLQPRHTA